MQKQIPKYQIKQNLLNVLGDSKKSSRFINRLKNSDDTDSISQVVNELIRIIPVFEKRCWGKIIPNNIEELGSESIYFYKPSSLKNEINWLILGIKRHQELIKKFINYREIFEHQVLLGEFDKALDTLSNVEKSIGVSIWLYESKFLVYELMGRQDNSMYLTSQINEAKKVKDKSNDNGFVTLLLHYLSCRAAKDLSAIKYDEDLFNNFKKNRTDFQKDYYNYYLFRLNFYVHYDIDDPAIPLVMEATNSLIDRYIVLLEVLQSAFVKGSEKDVVFYRSQALFKITQDKLLLPFIYHKQPKYPNNSYINKNYIRIIDSYYTGNYREVIRRCKEFVKTDTSCFDVLIFYCYSLLFERNGYSPIVSNSSTPINQICHKIYESINEKDNSSSLYNLYQFNKNLYGFSIANGLDYFIKTENNFDKSDKLKLLSLYYFDPLFSNIYEDEKTAISYLEYGLENIGASDSISHQIRQVSKEITSISSTIATYIIEEDNAKILYNNANYREAYSAWIKILENNRHNNPIIQNSVKYAFDCLIQLEKCQEAITLFVDEYIKSPIGIKKVDVLPFITLLKKNKYKGIKRTIELPIFVGLNSPKDTDKSFILQSFCDYCDVKKPSELFEELTGINTNKIETFFYVIVSEDILRHYVYINSTQESLEEKQKILSYLVSLKSRNEELYKKLADQVFEELIVFKGTKKMDESKIFANDQAIIKYELNDIEGLYDRFNIQYDLLETGTTFLVVDPSSFSNSGNINTEAAVLKANVKYTDNAIHQVAYALYNTIRDRFLYSKFGLGTYLSTRIRHGVLVLLCHIKID